MIQDLHSHTYYSFCGRDNPEQIVQAAIDGGIELFGITDHCHGAGHGRKNAYKAALKFVTERIKGYCEARGGFYMLVPAHQKLSDVFFGNLTDMEVLK